MNTKKLKQLVLDLAIHGKLVPQDPNDEPASVLLKRIVETHGRASNIGRASNKKSAISSEEIDEVPFEVPEGWVWALGSDIFRPMMSCKPIGEKFKYIDIESVDNKRNVITSIKTIDSLKAPSRASRKTEVGDVLFSMVRPYLRNIAKVKENDCIASTGFYVCKPREVLYEDYCFYLMISDYVVDGLNTFMKGDNSPSINNENITNWLYPLPPLSEQRRIVAEVEKWFGIIDQLESNEADLRKSIEQTKKKVLDLAIHGKLVPQDPNDEPASELLERIVETHGRASNKSKGKKSAISSEEIDEVPFEVPEGWVWTTIGGISSNILYGVNESAKDSGKYKLLRITDIQDNKVDWNSVPYTNYDEKKVCDYLLKKNDILFARTGATVGKSFLVEDEVSNCIYASYLIKVQTNELLDSKYIKRFFESAYYWSQISDNSIGTGQPNVNGTLLASLRIPLPPLSEQRRIVAKIEEVFKELDRMLEMIG